MKTKAAKSTAAQKPAAKKRSTAPKGTGTDAQSGQSPILIPAVGTNFEEAVGKVVAYINFIDRPTDDWQALEIRFTDGESLSFEFRPTLRTRVEHHRRNAKGDVKVVKDYGAFGDEPL